MVNKTLNVLLVEDSREEAELIIEEMCRSGFDPACRMAATVHDVEAALNKQTCDLIIFDEDTTGCNPLLVLDMVKQKGLDPPFIVITSSFTEESAAELIKSGVHDCLMKKDLVRLVPTIERELREAEDRRKIEHTRNTLLERDEQYRALFETIPVGIGFIDATGNLSTFNDAFFRAGGYDRGDMAMMKNMADLFLYEEIWRETFEEAKHKGSLHKKEVLLKRKDGNAYVAILSLIPLSIRGKPCWQVVVEDITERKKAEADIQQNMDKLSRVLDGIVQAMALTVEANAPDTAGHQRRVSQLASAIALEMDLNSDRINGIRIAGLLHDIGKVWTPSGVYNKPGRVSEGELDLIRVHPMAGYEILKTIEFPWPVARAVLQHHERVNGSGYPSGLSGDSLLLEARVLGVADVMEAMASHRPYRAAMSIETALKEIDDGKGTLYDPKVVEACFKCFNQRGFRLE